jgi:CRISPR associated protein Cas1
LSSPIGFLHADRKGRNSLVWDAIEPLRPSIDACVFAFIARREFSRSDFPQVSAHSFRLARPIIGEMLSAAMLPQAAITNAADAMLHLIERD